MDAMIPVLNPPASRSSWIWASMASPVPLFRLLDRIQDDRRNRRYLGVLPR